MFCPPGSLLYVITFSLAWVLNALGYSVRCVYVLWTVLSVLYAVCTCAPVLHTVCRLCVCTVLHCLSCSLFPYSNTTFGVKVFTDCVLGGMKDCIGVSMNRLCLCRNKTVSACLWTDYVLVGMKTVSAYLWTNYVLVGMENCIGVSSVWTDCVLVRMKKLYRRIYEQTVSL